MTNMSGCHGMHADLLVLRPEDGVRRVASPCVDDHMAVLLLLLHWQCPRMRLVNALCTYCRRMVVRMAVIHRRAFRSIVPLAACRAWNPCICVTDASLQEVLDWFSAKGLEAYSISFGAALLYNNIFPKHKERLGSKLSELLVTVAKVQPAAGRRHFDVVIACEDEDGEDIDVPLVSVRYR